MTTPADPHVSPEAVEASPATVVGPESAITDRMEQLRKTIAELTPEVTKLQQEQKSTWAWLKGGAGFVVFDILVTVAGLILGINVYSVSHQNDALISQLQAQQARLATSIHETCNLYGTFINFYSPAARDKFTGGAAQYDQLYLVLQKSADNLDCGVKHVVPGT